MSIIDDIKAGSLAHQILEFIGDNPMSDTKGIYGTVLANVRPLQNQRPCVECNMEHDDNCASQEHDEDGRRYGCNCEPGLRAQLAALSISESNLKECANKLLELVESGGCNIPSWTYISFRDAVGRPILREQ